MLDFLISQADGWDAWRLLSIALSLSGAIAYLGFVHQPFSMLRAVMKTFVVAALVPLPLTYLSSTSDDAVTLVVLSLALALSALGDWFLALESQKRFFVLGLGSFLLAHLAFVISFLPMASSPSASGFVLLLLALAFAGLLVRRIIPSLGKLRLPVLVYFAVIMVMVTVAFSVKEAGLWLGSGAALFAFSDGMIAVRKFLKPFAGINETVWISYVIAQYVVTATVIWVALKFSF